MLYEEEPDYGPMVVIRLSADYNEGLVLSPVTRPRYDILTAKYTRTLLARQLCEDRLRKWPLQLSEFDEAVRMTALIDRRMAADFSSYVSYTSGYTYAGYGVGASGFGYYDETSVAWIVPHQKSPAVFWRKSDPNGEGRAMTWLNLHADALEDGLLDQEHFVWPVNNAETKELVVPDELVTVAVNKRGIRRRVGTY